VESLYGYGLKRSILHHGYGVSLFSKEPKQGRLQLGLPISDKKNYSPEDGINGTIGLFRRVSGCSAEQKTLGIPFRTIPWKRKMLGIPLRVKKK
jgi:hypothetical protein